MVKHKKRVLRVVPASQAKNNFGELIRRVYEDDECQIIERAGLPVAAVVSISDLERLYPQKVKALPKVTTSAERQRATQQLLKLLDAAKGTSEHLDAAEVEADVAKAVEEVRYGRRA